jgi:hypothetical protein
MTRTAVAMAALLVAGQAVGQETITLNGVARTVSLTTALYGCGRYYPINTPLIEKMASASRRIGEEVAAREGKPNRLTPGAPPISQEADVVPAAFAWTLSLAFLLIV